MPRKWFVALVLAVFCLLAAAVGGRASAQPQLAPPAPDVCAAVPTAWVAQALGLPVAALGSCQSSVSAVDHTFIGNWSRRDSYTPEGYVEFIDDRYRGADGHWATVFGGLLNDHTSRTSLRVGGHTYRAVYIHNAKATTVDVNWTGPVWAFDGIRRWDLEVNVVVPVNHSGLERAKTLAAKVITKLH